MLSLKELSIVMRFLLLFYAINVFFKRQCEFYMEYCIFKKQPTNLENSKNFDLEIQGNGFKNNIMGFKVS